MEEERRQFTKAPRTAIFTFLTVWFLAVFVLGAAGLFVRPEQQPPLPILLGLILPLGIFLITLAAWPAFRLTLLTSDPRLLTAMQAWRAVGFVFVALHLNGILPGLFTWPAGLGDIAIGLSAVWVLAALLRDP